MGASHGSPTSDRDCGCVEAARWYVVETAPRAEFHVFSALGRFKCYLPTLVGKRKAMKGGRPILSRGYPVWEETIRPYFPNYLFVSFDLSEPDWPEICRTPNVRRLISTKEPRPIPVPSGFVEELMALGRAGDGAIDLDAPAFPQLTAGSEVRIKGGPLADHKATVTWSDERRVSILLQVLGASRSIQLPREHVEAA